MLARQAEHKQHQLSVKKPKLSEKEIFIKIEEFYFRKELKSMQKRSIDEFKQKLVKGILSHRVSPAQRDRLEVLKEKINDQTGVDHGIFIHRKNCSVGPS